METVGRLTGAIAQQFAEILTAISASAAVLSRALPPNRDLDSVKETAQRGTELTQKLLGFSRHRTLDLHPLSLSDFVREVLDGERRRFPANIEVQFVADEEGGVIDADAGAVRQILLNLVSNACDAMAKGGTLHVEVRRVRLDAADRSLHAWVEPGPYVSVALSDTGSGMEAKTLADHSDRQLVKRALAGGDAAAFQAADDAAAARLGASLDGLLAEPPEITMCQPVRMYGVSLI